MFVIASGGVGNSFNDFRGLRQAIHFPLILFPIVLFIDYPFGYNCGTKSSWVLVMVKWLEGWKRGLRLKRRNIYISLVCFVQYNVFV